MLLVIIIIAVVVLTIAIYPAALLAMHALDKRGNESAVKPCVTLRTNHEGNELKVLIYNIDEDNYKAIVLTRKPKSHAKRSERTKLNADSENRN